MAANIDFIKNAIESVNNSIQNTKKYIEERQEANSPLLFQSNRYKCIAECLPKIKQELDEKLPKIDLIIKEISAALWDSIIIEYAQKLKNALSEANKGLEKVMKYWKEEDVLIATNYKNQIQKRIDNLKC